MELQTQSNYAIRFKPKSNAVKCRGGIFTQGRFLIGRADNCDLMINSDAVSAIHAVIELRNSTATLYDMNSTNGTYINGEKVVTKQITPGAIVKIGNIDFVIENYQDSKDLPPMLESLSPSTGKALPSKKPPTAPAVTPDGLPAVVYPLALDPRADKSEYIFEDAETVYPIFKYDYSKQAAEVIILHNDRVYSVDYIPSRNGQYFLSGLQRKNTELEFPYLGKNEVVPFIEVHGGQVTVHKLYGYDVLLLTDQKVKAVNQSTGQIDLKAQDIIRFSKGSIQIFVRLVEAPPKVKAAPLIKRDPVLRKNLTTGIILSLFLITLILFSHFEVPEEKKEDIEKERLATILYKQKLTVSKEKAVEKTPDKPKKVQQAPKKVAVKPTQEPKPTPKEITKPDIKEVVKTTPKEMGEVKAPTKQEVKKGETLKPDTRITNKPTASSSSAQISPNQMSKSTSTLKSKGPVDVYKSADFSSSLNSLMAKGGSLSDIKTQKVGGTSLGNIGSGISGTGSSMGSLKKAEIGSNIGSLTGNTQGVIGASKGAEGLSAKKGIYTAGIPAETVVLGSMDPDVIRRILLDHLPQFRYCYQSELERSGTEVQGVIKLNFAIGASGHVTSAGVDDSNLSPNVRKCVVNVLRGINFPEPMGGGTVEVKQPMNFYPKKI